MNLFFLLLFLSLPGREPSDIGISYRMLSWSDFRGPIPENEPMIGARTTTEIDLTTDEDNGRFKYHVKAYFLPYYSFVRVRSEENLRHEQTHFRIACMEARECQEALRPFQGGNAATDESAKRVYENYVRWSADLNATFDQETNHGLIPEIEKIWEEKIAQQLKFILNGRSK